MPKYTSLTSLFTAIADAIRSKTGGTDTIPADDFPEAIQGIEGGSAGGEMTADGAEIYIVREGQLLTIGAFLALMIGQTSPEATIVFSEMTMVIVRDELPSLVTRTNEHTWFGVTNGNGKVYMYDSEWAPFGDVLGFPDHGWIDMTTLESLDYTDESNFGIYVVKKVSYPIYDGTLTDFITDVEHVKSIFYEYCALNTINLPSATIIGSRAFFECKALNSVSIPSVEYIGSQAFQRCEGLTQINFPKTLKCIGLKAFLYCTKLTTITYDGTMAQWGEIVLDGNWNLGVPATEVICSDGTVSLV